MACHAPSSTGSVSAVTKTGAVPLQECSSPSSPSGMNAMRRRQLLVNLGLAAASAVGGHVTAAIPVSASDEVRVGERLAGRVRTAMLGFLPGPVDISGPGVRAGLAVALADFRRCHYSRLADRLPRLISAGHLLADGETAEASALLAEIYTLTARMLIKLDQPLARMAADRARVLAAGGGDPLIIAEAARNLAVLARRAGRHDQAMSVALTAAASPGLGGCDPRLAAERGLLIQSAAYTAARAGDRAGMRELTSEAAAIAGRLGGVLLPDHGDGFSPATVQLHRISAEIHAGDAGAAVAAARQIVPGSLATTERRARFWTDTARAYGMWGRREECIAALLAAEHEAPQDVHARPAARDLVRGLLVSGRVSQELRGLAGRCRIS